MTPLLGAPVGSAPCTGVAYYGGCGGSLAALGRDYLGCSTERRSGSCDNRRDIRRRPLEALILDALHSRLMAPELVEAFVAAFEEEAAPSAALEAEPVAPV